MIRTATSLMGRTGRNAEPFKRNAKTADKSTLPKSIQRILQYAASHGGATHPLTAYAETWESSGIGDAMSWRKTGESYIRRIYRIEAELTLAIPLVFIATNRMERICILHCDSRLKWTSPSKPDCCEHCWSSKDWLLNSEIPSSVPVWILWLFHPTRPTTSILDQLGHQKHRNLKSAATFVSQSKEFTTTVGV